jgi:hypothetical protein
MMEHQLLSLLMNQAMPKPEPPLFYRIWRASAWRMICSTACSHAPFEASLNNTPGHRCTMIVARNATPLFYTRQQLCNVYTATWEGTVMCADDGWVMCANCAAMEQVHKCDKMGQRAQCTRGRLRGKVSEPPRTLAMDFSL